MLYGWYALRTRRFPACRISVRGGQTLKSGKRAMRTTFARQHVAALTLTAALAVACASHDKQAAPAADSTKTSSDSAAVTVTASVGQRETKWGPRNTMGRI